MNVAGTGLSCATDLDAKSWNRSELVAGLEKATGETLSAANKIAMSADDRSGLGVLRTTAYGAPRTFGVTLSMHY